MNPLPRGKNTVKWNSERRIPRKSSENRRLFAGANLVVRPAYSLVPSEPSVFAEPVLLFRDRKISEKLGFFFDLFKRLFVAQTSRVIVYQ